MTKDSNKKLAKFKSFNNFSLVIFNNAQGKEGSTKCLFSLCFNLKEDLRLEEYGGIFSIIYNLLNKLRYSPIVSTPISSKSLSLMSFCNVLFVTVVDSFLAKDLSNNSFYACLFLYCLIYKYLR